MRAVRDRLPQTVALYAKRTANIHVGRVRFVARRKKSLPGPQSQMQTHPHGLFVSGSPRGVWRPRASLVRREDMEIAPEGQGRFNAVFFSLFLAV